MDDRLSGLAEAATGRLGDDLIESVSHRGELTLRVKPAGLLPALTWLREESEPHFSMLTDISGIDGAGVDWSPRFRVSYHLLSPDLGLRVRVQADTIDDGDGSAPHLPSAIGLWEMADWNEREVWDLMGIRFDGHPDLRRILMHEDYDQGHPLQKQVPVRGVDNNNR